MAETRKIRATPDQAPVYQFQVSQIYSGANPNSKPAFISQAKPSKDYTQFELASRFFLRLTPTIPASAVVGVVVTAPDLVDYPQFELQTRKVLPTPVTIAAPTIRLISATKQPDVIDVSLGSRFFTTPVVPVVLSFSGTVRAKASYDASLFSLVSIPLAGLIPTALTNPTPIVIKAAQTVPQFESEDIQLYVGLTTVDDLPSLYFAGGTNQAGAYRGVPNYDYTISLNARLYNILVGTPAVIPVVPVDGLAFTGAQDWHDPRRWPRRFYT